MNLYLQQLGRNRGFPYADRSSGIVSKLESDRLTKGRNAEDLGFRRSASPEVILSRVLREEMRVVDPGVAVVIEDDLDIRNLVHKVFEQSGFEVHSVASGREGVDAVRRQITTVVTLDIGLPDIDGFEVLRRIRKYSKLLCCDVDGAGR